MKKTMPIKLMPIEGDICRGRELGRIRNGRHRWTLCPLCEKGRWLQIQRPPDMLCHSCASRTSATKRTIRKRWKWQNPSPRKGLSYIEQHGLEKAIRIKQKLSQALSGEKHPWYGQKAKLCPNWKGGRYNLKTGYIKVYSPNHPRVDAKGYVLEHILVWMESYPLPEGWDVHHINGIKDDNRLENLKSMPHAEHTFERNLAIKNRLATLEQRVTILEAENVALKEMLEEDGLWQFETQQGQQERKEGR